MTPAPQLTIATLRVEVERLKNQLAACRSTCRRYEARNRELLRELAELRKEREK